MELEPFERLPNDVSKARVKIAHDHEETVKRENRRVAVESSWLCEVFKDLDKVERVAILRSCYADVKARRQARLPKP